MPSPIPALRVRHCQQSSCLVAKPSRGVGQHHALAEAVLGLFNTKMIYGRGPWCSFEAVEFATLERIDWFNTHRRLEPIGNIPPAEAEAHDSAQTEVPASAA